MEDAEIPEGQFRVERLIAKRRGYTDLLSYSYSIYIYIYIYICNLYIYSYDN